MKELKNEISQKVKCIKTNKIIPYDVKSIYDADIIENMVKREMAADLGIYLLENGFITIDTNNDIRGVNLNIDFKFVTLNDLKTIFSNETRS